MLEDGDDKADSAFDPANHRRTIVYRINGPFFFGATQKLASVLNRIGEAPRAYLLDLSAVPLVDSTAVAMLKTVVKEAEGQGIAVVLAAATPGVRKMLGRYGLAAPSVQFDDTVESAIARTERKR
jgi:SulP family sulfate permease